MNPDKELALRMVTALEQLELDNRAYRSMFKALKNRLPPQSQMDSLIEQAKKSPEVLESVRQQYAPLRDRIERSADLSDLIQEFLRIVPAKKDVN